MTAAEPGEAADLHLVLPRVEHQLTLTPDERSAVKRLRAYADNPAGLAAARDRWLAADGRPARSLLGDALADHAFARAGCHLTPGERPYAARQRGAAAECAEDAWSALRHGLTGDARELLQAALRYLDGYDRAVQ